MTPTITQLGDITRNARSRLHTAIMKHDEAFASAIIAEWEARRRTMEEEGLAKVPTDNKITLVQTFDGKVPRLMSGDHCQDAMVKAFDGDTCGQITLRYDNRGETLELHRDSMATVALMLMASQREFTIR